MTDWGALYREHVSDLSALASGLSEEQVSVVVPGTPDWTVHDIYAHLAGGASDGVAGRMDGAPGPEWTARHVAERRDRSVADLTAELTSHVDAVAGSVIDNPRPAAVWDIAVHHADLHEALGLPRLPDHLWQPVVDHIAEHRAPGLAADVSSYELFRALFSRRSRSQMQAWGTGRTDDELDAVCIFGPRVDDQPVPA